MKAQSPNHWTTREFPSLVLQKWGWVLWEHAVGVGGASLELFLRRTKGHLQKWGCRRTGLSQECAPGLPLLLFDGLCFLQTDQQAEARSYLSEEMIAGEWGWAGWLLGSCVLGNAWCLGRQGGWT